MDDYDHQERSPSRDMSASQGTTLQGSVTSSTQSLGMAVISEVAARSNTDPVAMDSLYSVVNPDALDALFQPGTVGTIVFTYEGYEVVVHSDGEIDVTEVDE